MQTVEKKVKLRVLTKQTLSTDISWIWKMDTLEQELERLNKLFAVASFMLCEQDFRGLFRLRQGHSDLKAKIAESFKRFRNPSRRLGRNARKSQLATCDRLRLELQHLSGLLQKFRDKLLKAKTNTHRFL